MISLHSTRNDSTTSFPSLPDSTTKSPPTTMALILLRSLLEKWKAWVPLSPQRHRCLESQTHTILENKLVKIRRDSVINSYIFLKLHIDIVRNSRFVRRSSCSWRVWDALYVRKTLAVRPSIRLCKCLFSIVVYNTQNLQNKCSCVFVLYRAWDQFHE